jgi:hypothetical protein
MEMPKKWWQWFLVYPALIVSLIASLPTWFTYYKSYAIGVPYDNVSKAEEQRKLWERNLNCIKDNKKALVATTKTNDIVKVGACEDTGDIIVEVNKADGTMIARWVSFKELCKPCLVEIMTNTAFAMEAQGKMEIEVICQEQINERRLYRRVKVGNACYDEMVDLYSGEVKRESVRCEPCKDRKKK